MSRTDPNQIIAHVDLLRAVDRLLVQAQAVREKREVLDRILVDPASNRARQTTSKMEGRRRD